MRDKSEGGYHLAVEWYKYTFKSAPGTISFGNPDSERLRKLVEQCSMVLWR